MQSPPYCASPLQLAAPWARTSGLHVAYFGIMILLCVWPWGPPLGLLPTLLLSWAQRRFNVTLFCGYFLHMALHLTGPTAATLSAMRTHHAVFSDYVYLRHTRISLAPPRPPQVLCALCMLIAIMVLAPLVGALSVVRRIALPPAETGFSISRLSWPASCCAQDRTSTSGDWALHQQALLSCVLLPTAYLYVQ